MDAALTAPLLAAARLICIHGTSISKQPLASVTQRLLPSTSLATPDRAHKSNELVSEQLGVFHISIRGATGEHDPAPAAAHCCCCCNACLGMHVLHRLQAAPPQCDCSKQTVVLSLIGGDGPAPHRCRRQKPTRALSVLEPAHLGRMHVRRRRIAGASKWSAPGCAAAAAATAPRPWRHPGGATPA